MAGARQVLLVLSGAMSVALAYPAGDRTTAAITALVPVPREVSAWDAGTSATC